VLACLPPMRLAIASSLLFATRVAAAQPDVAPPDAPPTPPPAEPVPEKLPTPTTVESKVVPPSAPAEAKPAEPVRGPDEGFRFGSYGRLIAGTDLRGGKPERLLVGAVGPRVVEPSYLELEMSYGFETKRGIRLRPIITLAFDGTLFHETGQFDAHPALRNMYLDATLTSKVSAWVGSRMYRGDDIYLFDYWPLDDQNTVGGGLVVRSAELGAKDNGDVLELAGHVGFNRLDNPFQFQQVAVANPEQGATIVDQLNRERVIASATASYLMMRDPKLPSMKLKVHGEVHSLPSGTRARTDESGAPTGQLESLPGDSGYLIGAEVSLFGRSTVGYRDHLNLFARYAKGLAAFDELAPPTSFGSDLKTTNASELSFGLSGNYDTAFGNCMVGALSRRFIDADANTIDHDDGWEYALDARPLAKVLPDVFVGADISYQARFPRGLNPFTERAEDPAIFQIAPMIVYSPMGPSAYDRPQLRAVMSIAHLNQGALDTYVPDDPRHAHGTVYYVGLQAEWWFNSSNYKH